MKWKTNGLRPLGLSNTVLCTLLFSLTNCASAYADSYISNSNQHPKASRSRDYFEVIGAGSLSNVRMTNGRLQVTSSETDILKQTNQNAWSSPGAQLGVGYVHFIGKSRRFSKKTQWFTAIEPQINLYHNRYENNGRVYRFGNSAYNDLTYNMPIYSTRLMLDAALTIVSKREYSLFAIAGIGNSWNRIAYGDRTNNNDVCNTASLSMDKNSKSHFVWEAGAGVAYDINQKAKLSFEYLYTDYGHLTANGDMSGNITVPVVNAKFNLHTQALLLGLHFAL